MSWYWRDAHTTKWARKGVPQRAWAEARSSAEEDDGKKTLTLECSERPVQAIDLETRKLVDRIERARA
jgi:hypothetical protein